MVGLSGTGKSHLAQAIGHLVARQGHDVLFATQTHLFTSLRQAQAVGTYERRFQTLVNVPLLLIDDFGLKPLRPPEDETFHDLMAERYERAATVLTSTLDFGEWGEAFPANKLLGAATLDRLRHGAYRLILDGASYRSPKPLPPPASSPVAKGAKTAHAGGPFEPLISVLFGGAITAKIPGAITPKVDSSDIAWRNRMRFNVTIDCDEDGVWVVECPAIPGCISQGQSKDEALENIRDAIYQCLQVRAERGLPLTIETRQVEVAA